MFGRVKMSEMLEQLTATFYRHKTRKKKRSDYGLQLSKVFKKGRIKRIVPFF